MGPRTARTPGTAAPAVTTSRTRVAFAGPQPGPSNMHPVKNPAPGRESVTRRAPSPHFVKEPDGGAGFGTKCMLVAGATAQRERGSGAAAGRQPLS